VRRLYQQEWHGIRFDSFAEVSSSHLANGEFYKLFYSVFFKKYRNWQELDENWVKLKKETMNFIKNRIGSDKNKSILSIGCGLGLIEGWLVEDGYENLEISEISEIPISWISQKIPTEKRHIGLFPACVPENRKYDYILLVAVEYFYNDKELRKFLADVKNLLVPSGTCLLISFPDEDNGLLYLMIDTAKEYLKRILGVLGLRNIGQFWGYVRTPAELEASMKSAGFNDVTGTFIDTNTSWKNYSVVGRNN